MTGMLALLAVMRKKFLALITWTLLGAAVAGGINLLLPVVYEASAKVLIAAPYWNDSTALADPNFGGGKTLAYGDEFTQKRMASYVRLVTTPLVTHRVADRLRLGESGEDLARKLSGHSVPDTVVLEVRAQDASPVRAASIADAAARQTIDVIKEVERPPLSVVSPVQPVLTEPASVPVSAHLTANADEHRLRSDRRVLARTDLCRRVRRRARKSTASATRGRRRPYR